MAGGAEAKIAMFFQLLIGIPVIIQAAYKTRRKAGAEQVIAGTGRFCFLAATREEFRSSKSHPGWDRTVDFCLDPVPGFVIMNG